ncbi:hypothetical protein [Corynebacterium sp.]|uniref:hypothetical protein n=1 Tax=Corynebacterium sp. TaxID=1720 RepID=UPI0025B8549F|nr:hypothetical protein [Corynebacterium sp.]
MPGVFAMPGMSAMTMALGFMDRFRSMPMSDILRAALDLLVITIVALLIGWRPGGELWGGGRFSRSFCCSGSGWR